MPEDTVIAERVYIGSYEFEDSVLSRVKTPTGYWDASGTYHLMVTDFQGNTATVIRLGATAATAVQTNSYYPYGLPVSTSTGAGANHYRFGRKELETVSGVNLYDFEARAYSPAEGLFWSPDPLYGDADGAPHGIAARAYCAANPLRFIDPSGLRPSNYDSALMALAVYRDDKKDPDDEDKPTYSHCIQKLESRGWYISSFPTSIQKNHPAGTNIGVQSMLFEKTTNGVTEYCYVYAGTNSWEDGVDDVLQLVGASAEYSKAIENARVLSKELNGKELTFVGHSMGAGNATAANMATGRPAIAFNPAVVSKLTKLFNGLGEATNVTNFIVVPNNIIGIGGCIVNNIQKAIGLRPPGTIMLIPLSIINPINAHKMGNIVKYFEGKIR